MKAILVATHIAFAAIGIFLTFKCINPKNSEGLKNIIAQFQNIITEHSQASSHFSSSFLHLSSDIWAFLCNSIFFQTTLKEEIHPSSGPFSNNFSAPTHHSTLMNQLLVDVWDLHPLLLDDLETMNSIMHHLLTARGISVVSHSAEKFSGQGLTLTYLLSESHAAVHTWPEWGFAAFDFLTCGNVNLAELNDHLNWELERTTKDYQKREPQVRGQTDSQEDEEMLIRYDWSLLRRGEPPHPQKRVRNDGQALRQDMYMKKEQVHEEQSAFQKIEVWDIEAGPSMIWGEFDASERWLLLDGVHQGGNSIT